MLGEMESDVLPFKRTGTVRLPRLTHAPVILTRFLPRHGLSHGHSARAGTPPRARPRVHERTSKTESTRKRRGRKTKEKKRARAEDSLSPSADPNRGQRITIGPPNS